MFAIKMGKNQGKYKYWVRNALAENLIHDISAIGEYYNFCISGVMLTAGNFN